MNIFFYVEDMDADFRLVVTELRRCGWLSGAVIACQRGGPFEVLWPADYGREFSFWRTRPD